MSLVLLFHYLMLNMFRVLIHPSSGACDLFVELFRGLYCSGSMCVGVTLWSNKHKIFVLCIRIKYLKSEGNVNCIYGFSPYRAIKKICLCYKNHSFVFS